MMTMKEIAKEAGTSQATVSWVLSGNMSVSREVRNSVMECVKKHNYQPSVLARGLASNKTLLIGVIVPDISNPFFAELLRSLEGEAMRYGYSVILCNTDGNLSKEKYYVNVLKSYKVDGIILVPRNINDKFFAGMANSGEPLVIATISAENFDCVSISHRDAGRAVAKHLAGNGFTKFVFVGNTGDEKEAGFLVGIEDAGFNIGEDYLFVDMAGKGTMGDKITSLTRNVEKRERVGVFAMNDVVALIVLDALKERNFKIPEEVGLIGFDNTFIGKEVSPSISSVAQPTDEIGKLAVETLVDKITNGKDNTARNTILDSRIVARNSTVM